MKNKLKIILLLSAVLALVINASTAGIPKIYSGNSFKNVLVLGNSITRHSPSAKIGWNGDWGMAASSKEKDFVHILEKKLQRLSPSAVLNFQNISVFERSYWQYDLSRFDSLKSLHPDLIILRIGENVDSKLLQQNNFETYYKSLIEYFRKDNAEVSVLCVSSFWRKNDVDILIENAAKQTNCDYLKIGHLSERPENMALGQFENEGVAKHPSDRGMAAIADLIWQEVGLIKQH